MHMVISIVEGVIWRRRPPTYCQRMICVASTGDGLIGLWAIAMLHEEIFLCLMLFNLARLIHCLGACFLVMCVGLCLETLHMDGFLVWCIDECVVTGELSWLLDETKKYSLIYLFKLFTDEYISFTHFTTLLFVLPFQFIQCSVYFLSQV